MSYSHKYFKILNSLNLPPADFAVFGSGPLFAKGIVKEMNDLDVICRDTAWEMVKSIGQPQYLAEYDVTIATMMGDNITFGTRWGIGDPDINMLIDGAELIDGLPFVQLKHVVNYKLLRANTKDMHHIQLLEKAGYESLVEEIRSDMAGQE